MAQKLGEAFVGGGLAMWRVVEERERKVKEMEHRSNPPAIIGMDERRMRRRPTWSMISSAIKVQVKLVMAMERAVSVGEENPMRANMVAEKYMSEFCKVFVSVAK